ncbi:M48 family metallopeptidase [Phnomibacter sp. MR]|uniref:M48 family metallopeptidase n=1 Tax=Phnomibacter sp. MR TaxID=3042318 RepID=UPI003A7FE38A
MDEIRLGDIIIEVELKEIKNVHLSVYPPKGRVRIAAPKRMSLDTIRIYALSKLSWIKKQQQKFQAQKREAPREFLSREGHYYLGNRYLLKVIEHDASPAISLKHKTLEIRLRPNTDTLKRRSLLDEWYRAELKRLLPPIITKWEKVMGVTVNEFGIKKMKTKWGTCNIEAKRIWLNLELAKKPFQCIEYIVVHEMVHLLERNHNDKFIAHMNRFLPEWKELKKELNRLPVSHRDWGY